MPVELLGYSERGMINALCCDIRYKDHQEALPEQDAWLQQAARLQQFLDWCQFPFADPAPSFKGIKAAKLIVEQSFSDYGDLDLLILLDYTDGRKRAVLAEAKVSTDTGAPRTIHDQWDDFLTFLGGDRSKRSSLFVQLYRKVRLVERTANLNQQPPADAFTRRWSLGNNSVVLNAAALLAQYSSEPWFLAIVPDRREEVEQFFTDCLQAFNPPYDLPNWNVLRWGFLTWPDLHQQVQLQPNLWPQLMSNFEYNTHQIYPIVPQPAAIPAQGFRLHAGQAVYVAGPSARNCRVVPLQGIDGYFPRSFLVPTANLVAAAHAAAAVNPDTLRPVVGHVYQWDPPATDNPRPPRGGPVPMPPRPVQILDRGWETSAVRQVDEQNQVLGDQFHVFNHHMRLPAGGGEPGALPP